MLERLRIRDLAIVDSAEVVFGPGLNVVTGETGAGKSLLVQAVDLLVGGRADADAVREGADSAVVDGEFRLAGEAARRVAALLEAWGLEFDGQAVVVHRELTSEGRSRAAVNQSPVTLGSLKRLGEILADLHGQHEHQSLLRPDAGLMTLDRLAGLEGERTRYAEVLAAWREAQGELERLQASLASYAERRDTLIEAARELDQVRPGEGEEEQLRVEAARLAHADRLRALVLQALERLSEGEGAATAGLAAAGHAIEQAAALDPSLEQHLPGLREAAIAASEASRALNDYTSRLEADPQTLEAIEDRRERLARLSRKYRRDLPALIAWRAELARELAEGEDQEGTLERARERADRAESAARAAARALSRHRHAAAREWGSRLTRELKPLGFSHARLEIGVESPAGRVPALLATGLDEVTLRFTANPGEGPRPLQRIASGGELSRVMLALKCGLQAQDRVDVLLFDEVDSGIGGTVARAVGERLRWLSQHRQIVCVTHLPMIAALASHHLGVSKHVSGGRSVARIQPVEGEARVDELARMLAGDRVTETTRRQARELLASGAPRAGGAGARRATAAPSRAGR